MAGRTPKPWYRKSKKAWYVHLQGMTYRLGKEKEEAFRAFHRLMADHGEGIRADKSMTVGRLAECYFADLRRRVGERTLCVAQCYLKSLLSQLGHMQARQVRKHHVEAVVRQHGCWNATTENHVKSRIIAVYNWAVAQELLATNPLTGMKKPTAKSRGMQALISPLDHARLMGAAPDYLRNVLLALHQTGARPSEVLTVTAADFYPEKAAWVLQRHKTAYETGTVRVIFLTAELVALCSSLAGQFPQGPLFRTARGKPFPPGYYLARLVRGLSRQLGIAGVIPYGYRHTFATDALANGVPDAHVAELLGHSGTAMLHRHYAHLTAKAKVLREALGLVRPSEG